MPGTLDPPPIVDGVPDIWDRIRNAPHRLLALDYDGTLVPFRVERASAVLDPELRLILSHLADSPDTSLVIVSGRPLAQLSNFLGDLRAEWIGSHGWEYRSATGDIRRTPLSPAQREGLDLALHRARHAELTSRLEIKPAGLALHTRDLSPPDAVISLGTAIWRPLVSAFPLELRFFNGGVELRALGRDKGVAMSERLSSATAGTLPVYLGDDETDEDAFRVVKGSGIGIKVGSAGDSTAADGHLAGPCEVRHFLQHYLIVCRNFRNES
jgi:trehalose 6-phosphate phosphatase